MNDEPDRELIERATGGDAAARDDLFARSLPSLVDFLRARMGPMLRSQETSVDLAQSVCREVLSDLSDFEYRGEGAFLRWLKTRAEYKVLKRCRFYRQERRDVARRGPALDHLPDDGQPTDPRTASHDARALEEFDRLQQELDRLPPDYREVIVLSRIVGLTPEQVATRMGRSRAAVWTLLSRALARLALSIDGDPRG